VGYIPNGTICRFSVIENNLLPIADVSLQSRRNEHSEDVIRKLLSLDAIGLCARISTVIVDDSQCREALARRGPEAQSLLNLLQAVCLRTLC